MTKNIGVCRFEDCHAIGQPRHLPDVTAALLEVCGEHWPEVRERTADRANWMAVLRDGTLSFDAIESRS